MFRHREHPAKAPFFLFGGYYLNSYYELVCFILFTLTITISSFSSLYPYYKIGMEVN